MKITQYKPMDELQYFVDEYGIKLRIKEIDEEIERLKIAIKKVPFLDPIDTRYRKHDLVPKPITRAVMFCLMDVSGSMTEWKKEMSKRFFILLYRFLYNKYPTVDIIFIRHHTTAQEVDEEKFFHSVESGGTVVSSAQVVMLDIINRRYPSQQWDIYVSQASDGENFPEDNNTVYNLMESQIMPIVRYYTYVEVAKSTDYSFGSNYNLWPIYEKLASQFSETLALARIKHISEIFPAFHRLFHKTTYIGDR